VSGTPLPGNSLLQVAVWPLIRLPVNGNRRPGHVVSPSRMVERCNFFEESKSLPATKYHNNQQGAELNTQKTEYWRANIRLVTGCLLVWFIVSFGCGILLVDFFNQFQIGGYKLGFWFAQQGSIFSFLILIFYYAFRMNALDRRFGVSED
jgi:putative solute:sodium symporter small subunit